MKYTKAIGFVLIGDLSIWAAAFGLHFVPYDHWIVFPIFFTTALVIVGCAAGLIKTFE